MKRIRIIALLIGALLLTGCASPTNRPLTDNQDQPMIIMTSFYPIYIMTLNIADDVPGVKVVNLTPPQTGCLHDYQLKPSDIKNLAQARVLVINGAHMESFMDKVMSQYPELRVVEASKGADLLKDERTGEINPHLWVSIEGAIQEVETISRGLAEIDPKNSERFTDNANRYISRMRSLQQEMHQALEGIDNRNIVTFHEAFPYFAREFNLNIVSVVQREPGSEPSAAEIVATVKQVKESGVKVLFAEPQYSTGAAEVISRETGARVYLLDPVVSGPDDPDAYLNIMRKNMEVLKEALR